MEEIQGEDAQASTREKQIPCTGASPEADGIPKKLQLAPHRDDPHLENFGPRLCQAVKVGCPQAELIQEEDLQVSVVVEGGLARHGWRRLKEQWPKGKSDVHLWPPSIFQAALLRKLSKQHIPGAGLARLPG